MSFHLKSKTHGISFYPWRDNVLRHFKDQGLIESHNDFKMGLEELAELYEKDCTADDVFIAFRSKTLRSAVFNIIFHDEYGRFERRFTTYDELRHLHAIAPKLREVMETKPLVNYNPTSRDQ